MRMFGIKTKAVWKCLYVSSGSVYLPKTKNNKYSQSHWAVERNYQNKIKGVRDRNKMRSEKLKTRFWACKNRLGFQFSKSNDKGSELVK